MKPSTDFTHLENATVPRLLDAIGHHLYRKANHRDENPDLEAALEHHLFQRDLTPFDLGFLTPQKTLFTPKHNKINWDLHLPDPRIALVGNVALPMTLFEPEFTVRVEQNNPIPDPRDLLHYFPLRTGSVWKTPDHVIHVHPSPNAAADAPVAQLAWALYPNNQNRFIPKTNADAPFHLSSDQILETDFWTALARRYALLHGYPDPTPSLGGETIDYPNGEVTTRRHLITFLINGILL